MRSGWWILLLVATGLACRNPLACPELRVSKFQAPIGVASEPPDALIQLSVGNLEISRGRGSDLEAMIGGSFIVLNPGDLLTTAFIRASTPDDTGPELFRFPRFPRQGDMEYEGLASYFGHLPLDKLLSVLERGDAFLEVRTKEFPDAQLNGQWGLVDRGTWSAACGS